MNAKQPLGEASVIPAGMTDKTRILVIDDDAGLRKTLSDILRTKGYAVRTAQDGAEALATFGEWSANLLLIDLKLPDMTGIEILNRVKAGSPSTQAIILTGNATLDSAIEATNKGAFSYLQKPYDIEQLLLNAKRAIEKQQAEEKILRDSVELRRLNAELEKLYEEAKESSLHDALTGLANRRSMELQMKASMEISKRYGTALSVIMVDIDHFKKYNDTHGHPEGDRLLAGVADTLRKTVRTTDQVFRYGGEEFLVMLPSTDLRCAGIAAERLRKSVESAGTVTISLGVASFGDAAQTVEELIAKADGALYRAKEGGRNRVEVEGDVKEASSACA